MTVSASAASAEVLDDHHTKASLAKKDPYVDVTDFKDEDFELNCPQPTYNGRTYYRAAFLLAHASSGQHLDHTFDYGSRRIYNVVHGIWYEFGVYCMLGTLHCILGLYSTDALAPYYSMQIVLETLVLMVYAMDIWFVRRLALEDENARVTPETRHATLHEGYEDPRKNKKEMVGSHWNNMRIVFVLLFLADFVLYLTLNTLRYTTFLRPLMIVLRVRQFRHMMRAVVWSATRISRVFIIISFHVVFCGFVAFVLFSGTTTTHFSVLSDSILNMLLILTAPGTVLGSMESIYASSEGFGVLFFIIFVIMGNLLLFKIVLATAYRSFKTFMKKELLRTKGNRNHAIATAFDMVTIEGTMDSKVWRRLYVEMALQNRETFQSDLIHEMGCGWICCSGSHGNGGDARGSGSGSGGRGGGVVGTASTINPTEVTAAMPTTTTTIAATTTSFNKEAHRTEVFTKMEKTHVMLSADAIFRVIDFDHSGVIEFPEFKRGIRMMENVRVKTEKKKAPTPKTPHGQCWHCTHRWWNSGKRRWRAIFAYPVYKLFDIDGDGEVNGKDVVACLCRCDPEENEGEDVSSNAEDSHDHHHQGHHQLLLADVLVDLIVLVCKSLAYFDQCHLYFILLTNL